MSNAVLPRAIRERVLRALYMLGFFAPNTAGMTTLPPFLTGRTSIRGKPCRKVRLSCIAALLAYALVIRTA
jgi:hypothetical protein